jgi:hypothetical protein
VEEGRYNKRYEDKIEKLGTFKSQIDVVTFNGPSRNDMTSLLFSFSVALYFLDSLILLYIFRRLQPST